MSTLKTIQIFSDTRGRATCNASTCRATIEWAEVVASGKRMCFDAPIVALTTHHDPATRRLVEVVDLSTNHWASCPAAGQFKRRRA
jgi:hypothetical protein